MQGWGEQLAFRKTDFRSPEGRNDSLPVQKRHNSVIQLKTRRSHSVLLRRSPH